MGTILNDEPIEILLVEDNPADIRLTREIFAGAKVYNKISEVRNGIEALSFLRKKGKYADAIMPDLILLDLNFPKKDGREVLAEIKVDEKLKHIPVIVFTTSNAEQDVFESYNMHANCYIIKPLDLNQFVNTIKCIESFWLSIVKLTRKKKNCSTQAGEK